LSVQYVDVSGSVFPWRSTKLTRRLYRASVDL
jgi:hypothetical protein